MTPGRSSIEALITGKVFMGEEELANGMAEHILDQYQKQH